MWIGNTINSGNNCLDRYVFSPDLNISSVSAVSVIPDGMNVPHCWCSMMKSAAAESSSGVGNLYLVTPP